MDWTDLIPHVPTWAAYAMIPLAVISIIARAYHE
jgi:hypothetical protein